MHEEKERLLLARHFDRNAYFNRAVKKVFSAEIVDDRSEGWLAEAIAEPNESGSWVFYANPLPSEQAKQAFLSSIA